MTDADRSRMMISYIETMNDKDYIVSINGKSMKAYIFPTKDCIKIDLTASEKAREMIDYLLEMTQDEKE